MLAIQWSDTVSSLPHFLKDGDTLTRDLSRLTVKKHHCNLTMDIVRLYPSLNLQHVIETLDEFFRNRLPAETDTFELEEHELDMELLEVALFSNFCHFAGNVYLSKKGFATGLANGRETAEIYLHCLEIGLIRKYESNMLYFRRYVDDAYGWFVNEQQAENFVAEYNQLHVSIKTTHDISREGGVCLDVEGFKRNGWHLSGRLDLRTYQKPGNAYLYIPWNSEHPQHVKKSFITAELMRYIKRSSQIEYFLVTKAHFWSRLRARGYPERFLKPIFERVVYSDRWRFLHYTAMLTKALKQPQVSPAPPAATLAITLPYTQRLTLMEVQQALILVSDRSLTKISE
eukprot:SAG11_NODE_7434_length_1144_cov_1.400000_1_plen_342_part_01